jgi:hypothetical protein
MAARLLKAHVAAKTPCGLAKDRLQPYRLLDLHNYVCLQTRNGWQTRCCRQLSTRPTSCAGPIWLDTKIVSTEACELVYNTALVQLHLRLLGVLLVC